MNTLDQKVKGSLFKGVTNKEFCDEVLNYFLPRFNAPIRYEPNSNTLSDMGWKHYGEHNLTEFLNQPKNRGNWYIVVSNKGREVKTELTPEMVDYITQKINL